MAASGRAPECVQDYPRPPLLEREPGRVRIVLGGQTVADTGEAWRVCETHHPPTFYLPRDAFVEGALVEVGGGGSLCEWKGRAVYFTVRGGGGRAAERAAWSYPNPVPAFAAIRNHVAVYCRDMDECTVGGDVAKPQPGGFYGGWVMPYNTGRIKGAPGTEWW